MRRGACRGLPVRGGLSWILLGSNINEAIGTPVAIYLRRLIRAETMQVGVPVVISQQ